MTRRSVVHEEEAEVIALIQALRSVGRSAPELRRAARCGLSPEIVEGCW
jgi:hypothetical protein